MSDITVQDEAVSKSRLTLKDAHDIKLLALAGAVGGFASWVFGLVTDEPVPGGLWAVPASIFLGAFAACVGIYVTNPDTSRFARTLIFAALCGFCWKPVCDAGKATIELAMQQKQDAAAQEQADEVAQLADTLAQTPSDQLAAKLDEVDNAAQAALEALPHVTSSKVRRDVESKVNAALQAVTQVAQKNPQTAARVIQSVGESAVHNQTPKVTATAMTSLESLAPRDRAFSAASAQLQTNAVDTIKRRYLLDQRLRPLRPN